MAHPKDRSGLSRKELLTGAAAGGRRRRRPRGSRRRARTRRRPIGACDERRPGSPLVEPKPVGPGGLPLPRPDNAVTWAITDDNQPIADGRADRGGPAPGLQLRRLPLPGARQEVREAARARRSRSRPTTRPTRRSRSSRPARSTFDVIIGLSGLEHRQPDRAAAAAAAQPRATCRTSRRTSGPSCRTRSTTAAAATRCRTSSGRTASAGATTSCARTSPAMDVPWDIFWESQAVPRQGRAPRRQARRAQHADAARRDARGAAARPQHRGPGDRRQGGPRPRAADRHLQHQGHDHGLPDAARGEDVAAPLVVGRPAQRRHLLPAARASSRRCSRTGGRSRTASCRTTSSASAARRRTRRSRTGSSTSCSTSATRYDNFVNQNGYTAAAEGDRRRRADQARADPDDARRRRRRGPTSSRSTRQLLQLSVAGERAWDQAWSKFKAG